MKRLHVLLWGIAHLLAAFFLTAGVNRLAAAPDRGQRPFVEPRTLAAPFAATDFTATVYQWEPIVFPTGVTTDTPSDLAVHPTNADIAFLSTWNGLYKTIDAGQSWTQIATTTLSYVPSFALAASNPSRLYASSWSSSFYRSDNGGGLWTQYSSPPSICGLSVAPSDQNRVYARSCGSTNEPALYRSDNGGQTWLTPTVAFTQSLSTLVISPTNSNLLIASNFDHTYRSADGGATWTEAPIGTRFFGTPAFDPQPPYTLYLGHWVGLLRSPDGGLTWQDGGIDREFTAIVASPFISGEALGGDASATWRIKSMGSQWTAASWNAPLPLQNLWRSATDNRVVYARTSAGLWRYVAHNLIVSSAIYLPLIQNSAGSGSFPVAQQALDELNHYRALAGSPLLQLHPAIVAAAQNHANYSVLNSGDSSAWTNGAHGEVAGKPGFTGVWPNDRLVAAGYPTGTGWWGGSEVMHGLDDPIASVDGWLATVYHRVIAIDPGASYTGYGNGPGVDVMDFGGGPTSAGAWTSGIPYPLGYPSNGQTDVPPSWGGGEGPSPLPPNAPTPVGYPFTLQGVGGTLQVTSAQLIDGNSQVVAVYPNPSDCSSFNCYALIAVAPLQPNMTYTVHAQGNVGGIAFNRSWTFTTGASSSLMTIGSEHRMGPPVRRP